MKKFIIAIFYALPFAYFAMAVDYIKGSILSYVLMMVCLSFLTCLFFKQKKLKIAILGNVVSFLMSYVCVIKFPLSGHWDCFFKPFTTEGMVIFLTVISLLIQLAAVAAVKGKNKIKK